MCILFFNFDKVMLFLVFMKDIEVLYLVLCGYDLIVFWLFLIWKLFELIIMFLLFGLIVFWILWKDFELKWIFFELIVLIEVVLGFCLLNSIFLFFLVFVIWVVSIRVWGILIVCKCLFLLDLLLICLFFFLFLELNFLILVFLCICII